jgi:hypothetical protein
MGFSDGSGKETASKFEQKIKSQAKRKMKSVVIIFFDINGIARKEFVLIG